MSKDLDPTGGAFSGRIREFLFSVKKLSREFRLYRIKWFNAWQNQRSRKTRFSNVRIKEQKKDLIFEIFKCFFF